MYKIFNYFLFINKILKKLFNFKIYIYKNIFIIYYIYKDSNNIFYIQFSFINESLL